MNSLLISGVITAIFTLLQEIIGRKSNVTNIKLQEGDLILESVGGIYGLLITQRSNAFLRSALRTFIKNFYNKFQKELEELTVDLDVFNDDDSRILVHNAFGLG